MKNLTILFFLIIFQIKGFSQNRQEDKLIEAFIEFKNTDEYTDSLKYNQNLVKLNSEIENTIQNENILNYKKFKKITDSLDINYSIKKSENNDLLLFTMSDNMFHWNYIVYNNVVVLKDHKWHEYFTEIHNLTKNEFLLIEQRDDLVFSCNYAYVFQKAKMTLKKNKAFGNRTQLTLCNFTELQDNNSHWSEPARKISFNYKNKIISYGSCTNSMTGKTTIGKAKYINGNFKIKDCDERKDFE